MNRCYIGTLYTKNFHLIGNCCRVQTNKKGHCCLVIVLFIYLFFQDFPEMVKVGLSIGCPCNLIIKKKNSFLSSAKVSELILLGVFLESRLNGQNDIIF